MKTTGIKELNKAETSARLMRFTGEACRKRLFRLRQPFLGLLVTVVKSQIRKCLKTLFQEFILALIDRPWWIDFSSLFLNL